MLFSPFYNEAIIPKSSFKIVSLWDPLLWFLKAPVSVFEMDTGTTSHSVNLLSITVCCTQSSRHNLQVARTCKRFCFLPLHFLTWSPEHNLHKPTTQKIIQNLILKSPLGDWNIPFLKNSGSPHILLKIKISWKASVMCFNYKIMLVVQTPLHHSAPSWYLTNMKTQISNPVKANGKTYLERLSLKDQILFREFLFQGYFVLHRVKNVIIFQSEILQAVDLECELVPLHILENQKQCVYLI